jgi:predicted Fe-Mo cluster-binding NifX family protein
MKIAIPADEKSLKSDVCPSFGRAPYYLLYDSVTQDCHYLDNGAAASQGGAGIKAAQIIADQGVHVLLTPRCGENAEKVLHQSEVLIYKTIPGTVQQNLDAFEAEQLILLNDFHPGFHGHEK